MSDVQIIEKEGRPEWAVVRYELFLKLKEDAEMLQDIHAYDAAKTALEQGKDEIVPVEVLDVLLDGENPIKVWREYRGLTQRQLAELSGLSVPYLSQLEGGKRGGGVDSLTAIAKVLGVNLDDLV